MEQRLQDRKKTVGQGMWNVECGIWDVRCEAKKDPCTQRLRTTPAVAGTPGSDTGVAADAETRRQSFAPSFHAPASRSLHDKVRESDETGLQPISPL